MNLIEVIFFLLIFAVPISFGLQGVPPLDSEQQPDGCTGFQWFTCETGSGFPSNRENHFNCCQGRADFYCPSHECIRGGGCCPDNFPYFCNNYLGNSFCCPETDPVCGPEKKCFKGSCSCNNCSGPNPCQYQDCYSCESCCKNYIPGICTSFSCNPQGNLVGTRTFHATIDCNSPPPSVSPSPSPSPSPSFPPPPSSHSPRLPFHWRRGLNLTLLSLIGLLMLGTCCCFFLFCR